MNTIAYQWASLEMMQMLHLPRKQRLLLRPVFYCGAKALLDIAAKRQLPAHVNQAALRDELLAISEGWPKSDTMTIYAQWSAFQPAAAHLPTASRESVRQTFYCGAKGMYDILMPMAGLTAIERELDQFRKGRP